MRTHLAVYIGVVEKGKDLNIQSEDKVHAKAGVQYIFECLSIGAEKLHVVYELRRCLVT